MLTNIHVKNMALIDEADVDLYNGLNILTGETGAGKSIIIGSINIALGSRVGQDIIRDGADYALSELTFHLNDEKKLELLKHMDIEDLDTGDIIISRKITPVKSTIKVNGQTFTLSQVKKIASVLIDIHGQKDNLTLADESRHLKLIDEFDDRQISKTKEKLKDLLSEYNEQKKKLSALDMSESEIVREKSFLEYEINEIDSMNLVVGEDDTLEDEYRRLSNSKTIVNRLNEAHSLITEGESNCLDNLGNAIRAVLSALEYDSDIDSIRQILTDAEDLLSDGARQMADYIEDNEFDQKQFNDMSERLDALNSIKNKYNTNVEGIIQLAGEKRERLTALENYADTILSLNAKINKVEKEINLCCDNLTKFRKENAKKLCDSVRQALLELNFLDVKFTAEFEKNKNYSVDGNDYVRFMISTNPGEKMKPLSKIASGGEMSRIMLAIKTVAAQKDDTETLIFDEIDAGISGRTAQMVAEKMHELSENHQIICITHLPQIASMADTHFVINKVVDDKHTKTVINKLDYDKSVLELARLLGGSQITDTVISNAREMKETAKK